MIKSAKERNYTDVVVVNEDRRVPSRINLSKFQLNHFALTNGYKFRWNSDFPLA